MKALTWHGKRDVRVDEVPDPTIQEPTDAIIRDHARPALCGSDLHLYEVLGPFIDEGDMLGHEPMGVVEEVGPERHRPRGRRPRRRPVQHLLRHTAACATRACSPSARRPRSTSTARAPRCSATPSSTARSPAGQAELLRVPQAHYGADQGPRRAARRPLPVPVRRAAHRLAGRRVRGRPARAAASSCSASARSATCAPASPSTAARAA